MRFLSLFAGIGGFDLGLERAGHECAGQVEIEPFCRRVLERRFDAERWEDVRAVCVESAARGSHDDGIAGPEPPRRLYAGAFPVDLIVGGFPCQDLSVAGRRTGLAGERSGLFFEIVRIAKELEPTWGIFENVPGLLSSHRGRDMWAVLTGLRECWPAVGYRILDSRYFGVAQRRRRVFFVCGPSIESVRAVLFEPEGGGGDSAASGEARASVAASLTSGVGANSNNPGRRREDDVNLVAQVITARYRKGTDSDATDTLVTGTLNSGGNSSGFRTEPGEHLALSGPLGGGNDGIGRRTEDDPNLAISDGVRRLTPLECERLQGFPDGHTCICGASDEFRTAMRVAYEAAYAQHLPLGAARELCAVAQAALLRLLVRPSAPSECGGLHQGIGAEAGAALLHSIGMRPMWFDFGPDPTPQRREHAQQFARELGSTVPIVPHEGALARGHLCEPGRCVVGEGARQHHWEICRLDDATALACTCPDSPRHRALGNAVTVNVIEWLGAALAATNDPR